MDELEVKENIKKSVDRELDDISQIISIQETNGMIVPVNEQIEDVEEEKNKDILKIPFVSAVTSDDFTKRRIHFDLSGLIDLIKLLATLFWWIVYNFFMVKYDHEELGFFQILAISLIMATILFWSTIWEWIWGDTE